MSNSIDPDEMDLCCLKKPIIIACGSERVKSISPKQSPAFAYEPGHSTSYNVAICSQRRLRSACASARSDLSLRFPLEDAMDIVYPVSCEDDDQTARIPRLIGVFAWRLRSLLGNAVPLLVCE